MSKRKRTKGEAIFDLVHDWVELDDPKSIEEAVRRWTSIKPLKEKPLKVPA